MPKFKNEFKDPKTDSEIQLKSTKNDTLISENQSKSTKNCVIIRENPSESTENDTIISENQSKSTENITNSKNQLKSTKQIDYVSKFNLKPCSVKLKRLTQSDIITRKRKNNNKSKKENDIKQKENDIKQKKNDIKQKDVVNQSPYNDLELLGNNNIKSKKVENALILKKYPNNIEEIPNTNDRIYLMRFQCCICFKYYLKKKDTENHILAHTQRIYITNCLQNLYECSTCHILVQSILHFNAHTCCKNKQIVIANYVCFKCNNYFITEYKLKTHLRQAHNIILSFAKKHSTTKTIMEQCEKCYELFPNIQLKNNHQRTCGINFKCNSTTVINSDKNAEIKHDENKIKKICMPCQKKISPETSSNSTEITDEKIDKTKNICKYCLKKYRYESELDAHILECDRPYDLCHMCGFAIIEEKNVTTNIGQVIQSYDKTPEIRKSNVETDAGPSKIKIVEIRSLSKGSDFIPETRMCYIVNVNTTTQEIRNTVNFNGTRDLSCNEVLVQANMINPIEDMGGILCTAEIEHLQSESILPDLNNESDIQDQEYVQIKSEPSIPDYSDNENQETLLLCEEIDIKSEIIFPDSDIQTQGSDFVNITFEPDDCDFQNQDMLPEFVDVNTCI